jgi:hypothetical protein
MECRCPRKRCYKRKLGHDLQRFLQIFWSLEKSAQDLYVWVSACAKRYPNVSFSLCQKNPKDIFKIFQNMHVRSYKSQPVSACAIIMWVSACATRYLQNNHVSLSLCYKISSKWSCEPQPVIQDIFKIIMWVSACAKDIFKLWMRLQHEWLKNAENNRGSQLRWHRLRATAARAWSVAGFWWTNGWAQSALLQSWVLVMAGWTDWSLDKGIVACDSGGGPLTKLERIIFNLSIGP